MVAENRVNGAEVFVVVATGPTECRQIKRSRMALEGALDLGHAKGCHCIVGLAPGAGSSANVSTEVVHYTLFQNRLHRH